MGQIIKRNFNSISALMGFLEEHTSKNRVMKNKHSAFDGSERFTQTKSWEEAIGLLKNGWEDMSKQLEQKLNVKLNDMQLKTNKVRSVYDVAGYQASVPRYLQGVPQSMINQKRIPQKQRVITIAKDICYTGSTSAETIIESSAKALAIVKAIEAKGIRVNLIAYQFNGDPNWSQQLLTSVKLKDASERLNISKMAFTLVHPSFFRRILFRYIEVEPLLTEMEFNFGYGRCGNSCNYAQRVIPELKDVYMLPLMIDDVDDILTDWGFK